jgi:hypothetical protein
MFRLRVYSASFDLYPHIMHYFYRLYQCAEYVVYQSMTTVIFFGWFDDDNEILCRDFSVPFVASSLTWPPSHNSVPVLHSNIY